MFLPNTITTKHTEPGKIDWTPYELPGQSLVICGDNALFLYNTVSWQSSYEASCQSLTLQSKPGLSHICYQSLVYPILAGKAVAADTCIQANVVFKTGVKSVFKARFDII